MKKAIILKFSLAFIVTGIFILSFTTKGFGLFSPPPPPDYQGGETGFDIVPPDKAGGSAGWNNDTGQSIHDVWVKAKASTGGIIPSDSYDVDIRVNGELVNWERDGDASTKSNGKWVSQSSEDDCPPQGDIVVGVSKDPPNTKFKQVINWFTDTEGRKIFPTETIANSDISSGSTTLLTLTISDNFPQDDWSIHVINGSSYLITGFTFSESPDSLTMSDLDISIAGTANPSTKTVTFDFPLGVNSGTVNISAEYSSEPTEDTTVSGAIAYSAVIPESSNHRQTFGPGTGISVPNIILDEVVFGAIDEESGEDEIILSPRNRFEFASINIVTVDSGNLQLGTPYISSGNIRIPIVAPSTNEGGSTITLSGININTLSGLVEGTISVRQEEPTGNNSNLYYAYYDPEA